MGNITRSFGRAAPLLPLASPLSLAAIMALVVVVLPRQALGDDTLHEGATVETGARSDKVALAHAQADVAILPFPGGAGLWNGPIDATRLEITGREELNPFGHPTVEHARVELIRWPHVHVLGAEHDRRMGSMVAGELVGVYAPVPLIGEIGGRRWLVMQGGLNIGYRLLSTDVGALVDGHSGASTALVSLNAQATFATRWAVRGLFEGTYTAAVGSIHEHAKYLHVAAFTGRVGLYLDVSPGSPVRMVPRTDPTTGDTTYRRETNEGRRLRVMLLAIEGETRAVDTISTAPDVAGFKVGMEYAY
jgi:hypothetical protein